MSAEPAAKRARMEDSTRSKVCIKVSFSYCVMVSWKHFEEAQRIYFRQETLS